MFEKFFYFFALKKLVSKTSHFKHNLKTGFSPVSYKLSLASHKTRILANYNKIYKNTFKG
ncbi:hypothetical protein UF75_4543 [Desulfosporosinus sp. I2]|nr:hypothetical protein UF75_4543 [Desulfosporosinus sp. I2]